MTRNAAALACVALLVAAHSAPAHTRSVSYSSWDLDAEGAQVAVRIPLLELSRLALDPVLDVGSDGRAARYLAAHLSLTAGGARCTPQEPLRAAPGKEGWAQFRFRVACPGRGPRVIETDVLLDVAPSHLHFARVAHAEGPPYERALTAAEPRWLLDPSGGDGDAPAGSRGTSLVGYVAIGLEHIVTGWDHVAFLVALLLLATGLREVAWLVTAFTVAHSVTLGLAVLGVVHPEATAVEALIGYSIALVAAENAWLIGGRGRAVPGAVVGGTAATAALAACGVGVVGPLVLTGMTIFASCHFGLLARVARPARLRAAVAFAFGLLHGFGFASVLSALELPTARVVPALLGFNVGVELGQLAVVATVWPLLAWLAARTRMHPRVAAAGSAAVGGLGVFWFASRWLV